MGRRASDFAGKRLGTWTVEGDSGERYQGSVVWLLRCDCGRTCLATSRELARGSVPPCDSCGGAAVRSAAVEPGMVFGALTVERVDGARARVMCECGRVREVEVRDLVRGAATSCGCGVERHRRAAASCGAVEGTRLSSLTQKTRDASASGVTGVTRGSVEGSWMARIKLAGEDYYLGQFPSLDAAVRARRDAEAALYAPLLERHGRQPDSRGR